MNTSIKYRLRILAALALAGTLTPPVLAGGAGVQRSWSGPNGNSVQKQLMLEDGTLTRQVQRNGAAGGSSSVTRSGSPGQWTVQRSGPQGNTLQRSNSVTRDENGVQVERQASGPGGGSRSVNRSWSAGE